MPDRRDAPPHPPVVASPCIRNCCLDEHDICLGCYRSLTEICAWGEAGETTRRAILDKAARRKQQYANTPPEKT